jgi:Fur family transcriptional regulator, ferric uptake regulator
MRLISGLKNTPSRLAILSVLEKGKYPLDALQVYKAVKNNTDLATVYRTLETFSENGLVDKFDLEEGKYRYEIKKKHHHHLVCEACGRIEDIFSNDVFALEKEIKSKYEFLVKRHALEFFGLCRSCQK